MPAGRRQEPDTIIAPSQSHAATRARPGTTLTAKESRRRQGRTPPGYGFPERTTSRGGTASLASSWPVATWVVIAVDASGRRRRPARPAVIASPVAANWVPSSEVTMRTMVSIAAKPTAVTRLKALRARRSRRPPAIGQVPLRPRKQWLPTPQPRLWQEKTEGSCGASQAKTG
jgi:hypothetical protein